MLTEVVDAVIGDGTRRDSHEVEIADAAVEILQEGQVGGGAPSRRRPRNRAAG